MANDERIEAYATALLEVARSEDALDEVEDELFRFNRALAANDQLRTTLTDAMIPVDRRQAVVEDLLGGKASPTTTSLVSLVIGLGRSHDLPAIVDRLVERAATERRRAVAEVRTTVALDEEQQRRLAAALGKATGRDVDVKVIQDPSIIGGIVAKVGDVVIDGSVRRRLELVKDSFSS